jgi:maltokinase
MIKPDVLARALPDYLAAQRWFAGGRPAKVEVVASEVLRPPWPALLWAKAVADGVTYQVLLGARPETDAPAFLRGHEHEVVGVLESEQGGTIVYEALLDTELAMAFLHVVAPDLTDVERVRPITVEQSNSSIVFDDRHILKLFRKLAGTANPDVEVTEALAGVGFTHVAQLEGVWRRDGDDLAVVQQFLSGGVEGFVLALTSIRDLYDSKTDPAECGGDFASEAERLGTMTAGLHLALAEGFGVEPGRGEEWADAIDAQLDAIDTQGLPVAQLRHIVQRLRDLDDAGPAVRVHGDYHLGQVMRTEAGWHVLDFEGEPLRTMEERTRPTSPFKDVSALLRSFHYATAVVLREQLPAEQDELVELAAAWEERNRDAFLTGYLGADGIDRLVPAEVSSQLAVLTAFEVEKAVYELGYEQSYRPEWVTIPTDALHRLAAIDKG